MLCSYNAYSYILLLLDFVHGATDTQTLKRYVSEADSASVFRQEAWCPEMEAKPHSFELRHFHIQYNAEQ